MSTTTLPRLELRPYQEEASEATIDAARSGITAPWSCCPLGRGKQSCSPT
jgi:hypothetical protein